MGRKKKAVKVDEEVVDLVVPQEEEETTDEVVTEETNSEHPLPWMYDHKAKRTGLFKEYGETFDFLGHNSNNLPIMVEQALSYYGIKETAGRGNTPEIMEWAKNLGGWQGESYNADSIPWCGLFMAQVAKDSAVDMPHKMVWLRAKDWARVGTRAASAGLGDILIFSRKGGGHVGLYLAEDATHYYVLGGNQGDMVKVSRIAKDRIADIRRVAQHEGNPLVHAWAADAPVEETENEA